MPKRNAQQLRISLFSFQDIITSVTGIMILITLLLALELVNRKQNSPTAQTNEQTGQTKKSIGELKGEIADLQEQLDASGPSVSDLPSFDKGELQAMIDDIDDDTKAIIDELAKLDEELLRKLAKLTSQQGKSDEYTQDVGTKIKALQGQIAEFEQQTKDFDGSNRVYYSSGVEGKRVWIVEVTASGLGVAEIGVKSVPLQFSSVDDLQKWLATMTLIDHALFLLVKPGGAATLQELREALTGKIDFGYQVVAANLQILDPKLGAGTP